MADRIGLNAFVVQMREKYAKGPAYENQIKGAHDPTQLMCEYFLARQGKSTQVVKTAATFEVTRVERDDTIPAVFGLIDYGHYGKSGTLKNIIDGTVTHKKARSESDQSPRYFRFHFPNGRSRGVLVVQQNGNDGTKQSLEIDIKAFLDAQGISVTMNPLTHRDALEKYLEHGEPKTIRVTRHVPPKDAEDALRRMRIAGEDLDPGSVIEIVVRHSNILKRSAEKALSVVKKTDTANSLIHIEGLTYDDVALDVELGGRTRKMSITKDGGAAMRYDLSHDVQFTQDGHPIYASINLYAERLCRDLVDKLV